MNDILNDHDGFGRRRFIRALGAGAATVLAACAGSPVAESPKSRPSLTRATAVNHVAYAVTDYARTRDFYVEMFGMRVAWDDGTKCSVEFGDPARPDAFYIVAAKPGEKAYVNHIGYSIDDFVGNFVGQGDNEHSASLPFAAAARPGQPANSPKMDP